MRLVRNKSRRCIFHYYSTSVPDRTDGHVMMPNLKSPKHGAEALREVERKYENTESRDWV